LADTFAQNLQGKEVTRKILEAEELLGGTLVSGSVMSIS